MDKTGKKQVVASLNDEISKSKNIFIAQYKGLKVSDMNDLRAKLRKVSCKYKVIKNTLARVSFNGSGLDKLSSLYSGPAGLVISYDDNAIDVCKQLLSFSKEHEVFKVMAGLVEGKVLQKEEIVQLSTLPPKPVLISQTIGTMKSILTRLVNTVQNPVQKLVYALNDLSKKKQPQAES